MIRTLLALGLMASTVAPALAGRSVTLTRPGSNDSAGQPLRVDTASEGYRCHNGVCIFPAGNAGSSYAAPITSTGGKGQTPYTWSVVAGSLPAGLSLTPSYGVYRPTSTGRRPRSKQAGSPFRFETARGTRHDRPLPSRSTHRTRS